jgi:hypothetical protein
MRMPCQAVRNASGMHAGRLGLRCPCGRGRHIRSAPWLSLMRDSSGFWRHDARGSGDPLDDVRNAPGREFGCNVCGEGGEYETLTLDCPLFARGRIVLDAWTPALHSRDAVAPAGVLRPTAFHVQARPGASARAPAAAVVDVPAGDACRSAGALSLF